MSDIQREVSMSVGSISSSSVAAAYGSPAQAAAERPTEAADRPSVADHVAAADDGEPIRSVSATLGTLVDTSL
jgi:hypothetical protein